MAHRMTQGSCIGNLAARRLRRDPGRRAFGRKAFREVREIGFDQGVRGASDLAALRQQFRIPVAVGEHLARHIERDERDRNAGPQNDGCGLGIGRDVELGELRDIAAFTDRSSHGDDAGKARSSVGISLHEAREVRERPEREDLQRMGGPTQELIGEPGRGVCRKGPTFRQGEIGTSEAILAMDGAASIAPRRSASAQPAITGMSSRPRWWRSFNAFVVVRESPMLPATVVTPMTSSSGEAQTRKSASASSSPGSVSMRTGAGIF